MSTQTVSDPVALFTIGRSYCPGPKGPLKRKFGSFVPSSKAGDVGYPSPPMSSPPSPPRQPSEPIRDDLSSSAFGTTGSSGPMQTFPPPLSSPALHALPSLLPPSFPGPPPYPVTLPTQFETYQGPSSSAFGASSNAPAPATPTAGIATGTAGPASSRGIRRSKAHVASACVNCKRAHLSCDVQRPCARCVASGKQDTCYDVQHKKRGRPRLREETEFRVEQMLPEPPAGLTGQQIAGPSVPRPIAGTRHRRTESLRSLRSQASEGSSGSSLPTPMLPPPQSMLPPSTVPHPIGSLSPADVPTAFVDLDFVLIRANGPFQQIMSGGQDVAGRRLDEVASPADNESFNTIRDRLKGERDTREPTYMPPIVPPGHRPLEGVSEYDVDRLAHTFADRTYVWTRSLTSGLAETFPARVRLAKADMYFVMITLPTFRPVSGPPQPSPRTGTAMLPPEGSPSQLRASARLSPGTPQYPYTGLETSRMHPQPPGEQFSALRGFHYPATSPYPPYRAGPGTHQLPPPLSAPRLFAAEPPTAATPFTPRAAAREAERPLQPPFQLPPILGSTSSPAAGPSTDAPTVAGLQQVQPSDDEGGDESSPRKRRRVMGIDDVLQR